MNTRTAEIIVTNKNIEQSVEKSNRRYEIADQVISWAKVNHVSDLKCAVLPCENWYFEKLLLNMAEVAYNGDAPSFTIHGVERNRQVAIKSAINKPEQSILFNDSLHYLLTREQIINKKLGIGVIDNTVRKFNTDYNFIWADYCGRPNNDLIRHNGEYLGRMDKGGVLYVTYDISGKHCPDGREGLCKSLKISRKDISGGLIKKIIKVADKNCDKGYSVNCIYNVIYKGGDGSTMITLGFIIGKKSKLPHVIKKHVKDSTAQWRNNMKSRIKKGFNPFGIKIVRKMLKRKTTKTKAKSTMTSELRTIIHFMLDKGCTNEEISSKCGVNFNTIGALKAHRTMDKLGIKKGRPAKRS